MGKKPTIQEIQNSFINLIQQINDCTLSVVAFNEYNGRSAKVPLCCAIHGVQYKTYTSWLKTFQCPVCLRDKINKQQSKSFSYFLDEALKYGPIPYKYLEDSYTSFSYNISFICTTCNYINTKRIDSHLKFGVGCRCFSKSSTSNTWSLEELEFKFKREPALQAYSIKILKPFINTKQSFCNVTCNIHNTTKKYLVSELINSDRLQKNSIRCKECIKENRTKSHEQYKHDLYNIHGNTISISNNSFYTGSHNLINVTCNICNTSSNRLAYILIQSKNNACLNCKPISKPEENLRYFVKTLSNRDISCSSYRPKWLNGKELDIFIPEYNFAIEYNGTVFHHSTLGFSEYFDKTYKDFNYHSTKTKICKDNGFNLLHVFDFLWNDQKYKDIYTQIIKDVFIRNEFKSLKDYGINSFYYVNPSTLEYSTKQIENSVIVYT